MKKYVEKNQISLSSFQHEMLHYEKHKRFPYICFNALELSMFLDLLFQKRIIENAISYIFAVSVCLKIMHAAPFKILCFYITPSLFSPKPFFIFINHTFVLLSSFFLILFVLYSSIHCLAIFLIIYVFPAILKLWWTVVDKGIALIEISS